jgi:transcriptional regulator with PAS, ATPase and Fis domain
MNSRLLVTWLGHQDCWSLAAALGEETAKLIEAKIPKKRFTEGTEAGPGPIKTLVETVVFREIHLISNYAPEVSDAYRQWLGSRAIVHTVSLRDPVSNREDPSSYRAVFQAANSVFEDVRTRLRDGERLCIHLSPGTPTMAAVSLLLGKTKFPATLYQTYNGNVSEVELPFDITVDIVTELLRDTDRSLQFLASRVPGEVEGFESIVGQSSAIRIAVGRAERTAIRDVNVLLLGESGTGKEVFARAIHRASYRGKNDSDYKKFVPVNCAAIPHELFESELFGAEKGMATGVDAHAGAFELADGGTLFLDEVGECSLENQAKLLRALQPRSGDSPCTRWVRRIGGREERKLDVRVVAATNRNLIESLSRDFRDDLYYRLATVTIDLPSLRERHIDIELLAKDILGRINREFARTEPGYCDKVLTGPAMRKLKKHHWPGNVRELTNVLYQAAVMQREPSIGPIDIDAAITRMPSVSTPGPFSRQRSESFTLKKRLEQIERVFVEDAMEESDGNQTKAADLLGISQQALSKKLQKWELG